MGKATSPRAGGVSQRQGHRLAGLGLAAGILAASVFAISRPAADATPGAAGGPAHMNPSSWNPTDDHEPFESTGPYIFDSREPYATRTGPAEYRTGVGSFGEACRRAINTWAPIEPAYLTWRVKVESTDDYYAAENDADKLAFYVDTAHMSIQRGLAGVPGYETRADPIRKLDNALVIMHEMISTGGGQAPLFPDVGIPWERWDSIWDVLNQSHDEVLAACPAQS
jgi:hypothetical protein